MKTENEHAYDTQTLYKEVFNLNTVLNNLFIGITHELKCTMRMHVHCCQDFLESCDTRFGIDHKRRAKMKLEKVNFMWIIENGSRFECPITIKRAFIRRFKISPRAAKKL